METKKTPKADLEEKKIIFLEIGLIISLSLVLLGFQWKTHNKSIYESGVILHAEEIEEIIPITEQKHIPPPPPSVVLVTSINIVENDKTVDDDVVIDVEATEETAIEEYVFVSENYGIEEEFIDEQEPIFMVVESAPCFPGGLIELNRYFKENISYPSAAKDARIQGTVYLTFVIDKTGEITDVRILRSVGGGCDEEAIRVVKEMPNWEPGKQRGMPVNVQFTLPVKFILY